MLCAAGGRLCIDAGNTFPFPLLEKVSDASIVAF